MGEGIVWVLVAAKKIWFADEFLGPNPEAMRMMTGRWDDATLELHQICDLFLRSLQCPLSLNSETPETKIAFVTDEATPRSRPLDFRQW